MNILGPGVSVEHFHWFGVIHCRHYDWIDCIRFLEDHTVKLGGIVANTEGVGVSHGCPPSLVVQSLFRNTVTNIPLAGSLGSSTGQQILKNLAVWFILDRTVGTFVCLAWLEASVTTEFIRVIRYVMPGTSLQQYCVRSVKLYCDGRKLKNAKSHWNSDQIKKLKCSDPPKPAHSASLRPN